MHGIPMKATEKTISGVHIFEGRLDPGYVSRRSRKKQKKSHFRSGYNEIAAICIGKLKLNRIYHRYGYMQRRYKRMSKPFNGAAYWLTKVIQGKFYLLIFHMKILRGSHSNVLFKLRILFVQ